jgi:phage shock protein E
MKFKSLCKTLFVLLALSLSQLSYAETVWIDVRSSVERAVSSIDGDIHVAYTDIAEEVTKLYPDKSTEIHLYCQSGGRAEKAKSSLEAAGYTNVVNAGGISDARKERGIGQ